MPSIGRGISILRTQPYLLHSSLKQSTIIWINKSHLIYERINISNITWCLRGYLHIHLRLLILPVWPYLEDTKLQSGDQHFLMTILALEVAQGLHRPLTLLFGKKRRKKTHNELSNHKYYENLEINIPIDEFFAPTLARCTISFLSPNCIPFKPAIALKR